MMECRRKSCDNVRMRNGGRGLCKKHYDIVLKAERPVSKWVPADAARKHVEFLRGEDMTYALISEVSGLSKATLYNLVRGKSQHIQLHNEQILLAISPYREVSTGPDATVSAVASSRRLQGLCRMGFTQRYIAKRVGCSTDVLDKYLRLHGPMAKASIAQGIAELFDELQMTRLDSPILNTPHAKRTRTLAIRQGWALPMQWSEESIADPAAKPIEAGGGAAPFPERYAEMVEIGLSDSGIAPRMGIKYGALKHLLNKYEMPVGDELRTLAYKERRAA